MDSKATEKVMLVVSMLCLIMVLPTVHGFSPFSRSTRSGPSSTSSSTSGDLPFLPLPLASAFDSAATSLASIDGADGGSALGVAVPMAIGSTASLGISVNEWINLLFQRTTTGTADFEAEMLTDASHFVSDLLTIVAPTLPCLPLRAAAVIGHVLSIAADYIPDHMVAPDELIFQMIMLTFSWAALLQTLHPKIVAATTLPKTYQLRDGKAYTALFQPTGMTWEQFKSLSACAMDWVDVEPHQEVMGFNDCAAGSAGCTYWLYRGSIDVSNDQGEQLYTHASTGGGRKLKETAYKGLFGETALLQCLENTMNLPFPRSSKFPSEIQQSPVVRAGPSGATFLRISSTRLKRLTDHDADLATSLRTLLFYGVSSKLAEKYL